MSPFWGYFWKQLLWSVFQPVALRQRGHELFPASLNSVGNEAEEPGGWLRQYKPRTAFLKWFEFPAAVMCWVKTSPRINVWFRQIWKGRLRWRAPGAVSWGSVYPELQKKASPTQHKLVSNTSNQWGSRVYEVYFQKLGIELLRVDLAKAMVRTVPICYHSYTRKPCGDFHI